MRTPLPEVCFSEKSKGTKVRTSGGLFVSVIQPLQENLIRQVEVYRGLKECADHKQKALVINNLQEIEAVTVREEQLIIAASRLEKERLLFADQISQMLGKPAGKMTLSELAVSYPELESVKEELETVVSELIDVHELNTQLLEQAMKIVNFTVGMLTHQDKNSYQKPGQKENKGSDTLRFLDHRI